MTKHNWVPFQKHEYILIPNMYFKWTDRNIYICVRQEIAQKQNRENHNKLCLMLSLETCGP